MRRRLEKHLLCPVCGSLLGQASHQRWPGDLRVVDSLGRLVQPTRVSTLLQLTQQQLDAADAATRTQATARREFLRRHLSELVYELECPRGHRMLTTMPWLVSSVRSAKGKWVTVPTERPRG